MASLTTDMAALRLACGLAPHMEGRGPMGRPSGTVHCPRNVGREAVSWDRAGPILEEVAESWHEAGERKWRRGLSAEVGVAAPGEQAARQAAAQ